jgi:hypothetical protein
MNSFEESKDNKSARVRNLRTRNELVSGMINGNGTLVE